MEDQAITVTVTEAKAHLKALLDRVEAGENITITRYGRPVARMSGIALHKKPLGSLAAFRATLPYSEVSSSDLLRQMRDEEP